MTDDLPFLDVTDANFSTRSAVITEARAAHWCARTPLGLAVLRHRQAGLLLRDRRLRQGSYAWPDTPGLRGSFAEFWKRSIISQEGAEHKAQRLLARSALADDFVLALRPDFQRIALELVHDLCDTSEFEFITAFSEPFAGRAITTLLGLPDADARALARDASTLGLGMGLSAKQHEPAVNAATDRLMTLSDQLVARAQRGTDTTSYVARLVAPRAEISHQALLDLIVISIFGGVDTTRAQLGFAMALFADHPDQWTWLRANRDAIPQAIEEIIRTRPTTTWSTREAVEDFTFDGVDIRKGETLHIYVHATGTDPGAQDWGGFDIRQRRKAHFGFGGGAHHCLGQFVARTDMACALDVLLDAWTRIEIGSDAQFLPDSGNTSPAHLPVCPHWL